MAKKIICSVCLFFAVIAANGTTARADNETSAKEAFYQGRDYFRAGKYEAALEALKRAYTIKPHPALLRYMGQTQHRLGMLSSAMHSFQNYIQQVPGAADRAQVEVWMRRIEVDLSEAKSGRSKRRGHKTKHSSPSDKRVTQLDDEIPDALMWSSSASRNFTSSPVREVEQPSRWQTPTKWVMASVGLASLAAGVVFDRLAAGKSADAVALAEKNNQTLSQPTQAFNRDAYDVQSSYNTFKVASLGLLIGGGVVAATSVVLFFTDASAERRPTHATVSPIVSADTVGISSAVSF